MRHAIKEMIMSIFIVLWFLTNSEISRRNWQVPLEQKVNNLFIAHFCRITNEITPILILNEMHRVASAYY